MEPAARTVIQTQSPLIGLPPGSGPLSVIVSKMDPLTKFFARTTCKRLYDMIPFPVHLDLISFGKRVRVAERLCELVAREGFQSLLEWARARNYPWGTTAQAAARGGHTAVLDWVRGKGCEAPHSTICAYAAMHGQLEFLKNEHANGRFVGGEMTCTNAARGGHLEVLKWLRSPEINCYWNHLTSYHAAMAGQLETLEWLVANNAPWNPQNCLYTKDLAVKAWIKEWIKDHPADLARRRVV